MSPPSPPTDEFEDPEMEFYGIRLLATPYNQHPSPSYRPPLPPLDVLVTTEVTETSEVRTPFNETPIAWSFVTVGATKPGKLRKRNAKYASKTSDAMNPVGQGAGGVAETAGVREQAHAEEVARAQKVVRAQEVVRAEEVDRAEEVALFKKLALTDKKIAAGDTAGGTKQIASGVGEQARAEEVAAFKEIAGDVAVGGGAAGNAVAGDVAGVTKQVASVEGKVIDRGALAGEWRIVAEGRLVGEEGGIGQGESAGDVTEIEEELEKSLSRTQSQRKRYSSGYEPKRLSQAYGIVRDNERDERVVPEGW